VILADAHDDDIVSNHSDLSFRPAPSIDASRASIHRPSVEVHPLQPSFVGARLGQNHLHGAKARMSSGRDPPRHLPLQLASRCPRRLSFVRGDSAFATDASVGSNIRACFANAVLSLNSKNHPVVDVARPALRSVRDVMAT